jgi:hypothetical protein
MPKGIVLGTLTDNGSLNAQVQGDAGTRYSVFLDGGLGGGTLAFEGGDGVNFAPIMLMDPSDGSHNALIVQSDPGLYTFDALCRELRFTLTLATTPSLTITLYKQMRS